MANLLLKSTNAKMVWRRHIRTMSVITVVSLLGLMLAAAAMSPLVIYTNIVTSGVMSPAMLPTDIVQDTHGDRDRRQEVIKKLNEDKILISYLADAADMPDVDTLLSDVVDLLASVEGASLSSLQVSGDLGTSSYTLTLSGVAESRAAVIDVRDSFISNGGLEVIEFPISNLAPQGGEYNFIMKLVSKDNI